MVFNYWIGSKTGLWSGEHKMLEKPLILLVSYISHTLKRYSEFLSFFSSLVIIPTLSRVTPPVIAHRFTVLNLIKSVVLPVRKPVWMMLFTLWIVSPSWLTQWGIFFCIHKAFSHFVQLIFGFSRSNTVNQLSEPWCHSQMEILSSLVNVDDIQKPAV